METTTSAADKEEKEEQEQRKKIYIITGVILLIVTIIIIVVVLVVASPAKKGTSETLTTSEKFDGVVFEIITDCAEKMVEANASCDAITSAQRETLQSIFDEFNEDSDNEWNFAEFEAFFMETAAPNALFDELDADDDGELDFVEVMASLKVQSQITPSILTDTYAADIKQVYGYNASFDIDGDMDDWTWFAYAADLLLYEQFGSVYQGYPNGINEADWMNISCIREFEYLDTDDNEAQDIDVDEFITNAFTGFGIEYLVTRSNITLLYNHEEIEESDIEGIVDIINAALDWKTAPGLYNESVANATTRRRLWGWGKGKSKSNDDKCGDGAMANANNCASTNPNERKKRGSNSKGCGNSGVGFMACKRKICEESGKTEEQCMQIYANI